ncbi:MAG: hypothetical protein NT069_10160 [Planctomycetota bacterium]|nr:hypothetical protein [Planctomycetota bacterium]
MQQPPLTQRNPLDLAFWGLIVSICVVMGAGICVMSLSNQPTQVAKTKAKAGGRGKGAPKPAQNEEDGESPGNPAHGDRETSGQPDESYVENRVKFADRGIEPDVESTSPKGNILGAQSVNTKTQFSGIEHRLDEIASNLGALQQTVSSVTRNSPAPRGGLEPSVEFVREFRYLLETGHKGAFPSGYSQQDSERRPPESTHSPQRARNHSVPKPDLDPEPTFAGPIESDDDPEPRRQSAARPPVQTPVEDPPRTVIEEADEPLVTETDTTPEPNDLQLPDEPATDAVESPVPPRSLVSVDTSDETDEPDAVSDVGPSPSQETGPDLEAISSANTEKEEAHQSMEAPVVAPPADPDIARLETTDDPEVPPMPRELPTPDFPGRAAEPAQGPDKSFSDSVVPPEPAAQTKPLKAATPTPLTAVRVFRPKYLPVTTLLAEIEPRLTAGVGKVAASEYAPSSASIQTNRGRNANQGAIVVKDTADALERIEQLVERLDVPSQVNAEFAVDITAVGVRLGNGPREGIDLEQLSKYDVGFSLHSVHESLATANGVRCSTCPGGRANVALKLAVLSGEEHRMLQELRTNGPLQALARSRVTMRDGEASRLVVEQDDETGRPDPRRARCLGVRPVMLSDGAMRLELLPCVDESGAPVEEVGDQLKSVGEVVLKRGETAVFAGMIDEELVAPKSHPRILGNSRRTARSTMERTEWFFLVTPRIPTANDLAKQPRKARSVKQTAGR